MHKTIFRPQIDGFAFANSWTFDQAENNKIRSMLTAAVNGALMALNPAFGGALALFGAGSTIGNWIEEGLPENYGLCGGMAFAALDYFKANLVVPTGTGRSDCPTRETPEGEVLRAYLWRRMLESLSRGGAGASTLVWMAVLHLMPEHWPFRGGPRWLLARSKEHWSMLKGHIDAGEPWPIGLVGQTQIPFNNHQVLACGYEDPGDGTGTIYVYDMNCPGAEHTIQIDFRGITLSAIESCPSDSRGPLQGFFCETYLPARPPNMGLRYGALRKEQSSSEVCVIYGGAKFPIPSNAFNASGYSRAWVKVVPDGALSAIPTVPRDGILLKERSNSAIYIIYGGAKFHMPHPKELGLSRTMVRVVPNGTLSALPTVPKDDTLLRELPGSEVYVINGGAKFRIPGRDRFNQLGFSQLDIRVVPDGALAMLSDGGVA